MLSGFVTQTLTFMAILFIVVVGMAMLAVIVLYICDVGQTKHAIRHNYPVIGRFRALFEHLGKFFRQYFFAMDREEMPFNREQRNWVYRSAKNVDMTVPFGSTRDLQPTGTVIFANCPFPTMETDAVESEPIVIGPHCDTPYKAGSFFNVSGMSYGAISRVAVQALSRGAASAGVWLNTGEGGLSPYHQEGGCDLVFQIGTANYGVRDETGRLSEEKLRAVSAIPEVRMFEIKLSQGAKPGKGGLLPGCKVTSDIAAIRGIPEGQDSVSPNRRLEVNSPAELLDFIEHVRTVTGKPVGFKTVIGAYGWLDELFSEINRRGPKVAPDFITIDGGDGGSGAAPSSLMDYVGLPVSESLPMVVDRLVVHGLRERIKVIASGKLINPAEVAWALCAGADFCVSARGPMFALGCIQALQCNKNTCPTGITTHNPRLQRGLDPGEKSVRVASYVKNLVHEVGVIAHSCGVPEPRRLRRHHARMVTGTGRSVLLSDLYPDQKPVGALTRREQEPNIELGAK